MQKQKPPVETMDTSEHSPLLLVLAGVVIVAVLAGVALNAAAVQLNLHAQARHADTIDEVRISCSSGERMEFYSQTKNQIMYICPGSVYQLWILFDTGGQILREITGFKTDDIAYVARTILRDGYELRSGIIPDVLKALLFK